MGSTEMYTAPEPEGHNYMGQRAQSQWARSDKEQGPTNKKGMIKATTSKPSVMQWVKARRTSYITGKKPHRMRLQQREKHPYAICEAWDIVKMNLQSHAFSP